jgi:hypothetical protein
MFEILTLNQNKSNNQIVDMQLHISLFLETNLILSTLKITCPTETSNDIKTDFYKT